MELLRHITVASAPGLINGYMGWPSVARDEKSGRFYAVCSGCRVGHVCPFGKTLLFYSSDGDNWSAPVIADDSPLDDRDAGIAVLPDGRLLITNFSHPADAYINDYFKGIKPDSAVNEMICGQLRTYDNLTLLQRHGGSFVMVCDPETFKQYSKVRVPVSSPHGPSVCGGRLVYLGKEMYSDGCFFDGKTVSEKNKAIACWESRDGIEWSRAGGVEIPDGCTADNFHEPHVIALDGGNELLGAIRAQGSGSEVAHGFTIYLTRSRDGGKTWSVPQPTGLNGSPPHLMKHSSGAVVMSFARREAPASERAVISYDGGESWGGEIILDDRQANADLGYPASVECENGDIITVYYQRQAGAPRPSILGTRWRI